MNLDQAKQIIDLYGPDRLMIIVDNSLHLLLNKIILRGED